MQNKGLIKVFAIVFGLVCVYQLMFTYVATNVVGESEAYAISKVSENEEEYTVKREIAQQRYLDSVANHPAFLGVDYATAKEKELNKGLDLKGGINVILKISVRDILKGLANNSNDPAFNQALDNATEIQKQGTDTYLEAFYKAFEAIPGDNRLASPDIFFNKTLEGEIEMNMTNAQVRQVLQRKVDESIEAAFEVLRKRIDKFGVTQPNLQRLGNSGRILVELPGAKEIDRVKGLLQSTAQLEFWFVHKNTEFGNFLQNANSVIAQTIKPAENATTTQVDTTSTD